MVETSLLPEESFTEQNGYVSLTPDGGLKKKILSKGQGEAPPPGSKVYVHYVGTLLNGEKFDSSRDRNQLFEFQLSNGMVIKGWDIGVASMNLGEKCELICSPEYAYGENGSPPKIPPKSTLKFEVELFSFDKVLNSVKEKLEEAQKLKEEGNSEFKNQNFSYAQLLYQKAIKYLMDTHDANEEERSVIEELFIPLHSNSAACFLKLKEYSKAKGSCLSVLEKDSKNTKALFRLGQAYCGCGEFIDAIATLKKALEISPEDNSIKHEILVVRKAEQGYKDKERKMFSNIFG